MTILITNKWFKVWNDRFDLNTIEDQQIYPTIGINSGSRVIFHAIGLSSSELLYTNQTECQMDIAKLFVAIIIFLYLSSSFTTLTFVDILL